MPAQPVLKGRIQFLEEIVIYHFRMQSYYFEMMHFEHKMKERVQLELHIARGGPPRSIPDPPEPPQKPLRPSEYVEEAEGDLPGACQGLATGLTRDSARVERASHGI